MREAGNIEILNKGQSKRTYKESPNKDKRGGYEKSEVKQRKGKMGSLEPGIQSVVFAHSLLYEASDSREENHTEKNTQADNGGSIHIHAIPSNGREKV